MNKGGCAACEAGTAGQCRLPACLTEVVVLHPLALSHKAGCHQLIPLTLVMKQKAPTEPAVGLTLSRGGLGLHRKLAEGVID